MLPGDAGYACGTHGSRRRRRQLLLAHPLVMPALCRMGGSLRRHKKHKPRIIKARGRHACNRLHLVRSQRDRLLLPSARRARILHRPALILQRQKKKKHVKSNVPQELVVNAEEIKQKLGIE